MKNKAIAPAMRGTPTPTPTPIPIFSVLPRPPEVESFVNPCLDGFSVADAPEGCDTELCALIVCAAPAVLVPPPFAVLPPLPPFTAVCFVVDAADPVAAVEAALLAFVFVDVFDVVQNGACGASSQLGVVKANATVLNRARSHRITVDLNILRRNLIQKESKREEREDEHHKNAEQLANARAWTRHRRERGWLICC